MAQLSKATFDATYTNASGTFANNTTREISEADLRQFSDDIADSFVNKTTDVKFSPTGTEQLDVSVYNVISLYGNGTFVEFVEIGSAAILTGNSAPVTIVVAKGASTVLIPVMFFVHLDWNSIAYATNTTFRFEINGVAVTATNTTILPGTADRFTTMIPIALDTTTNVRNSPIQFKVQTGNPTAGNSPLRITCIYRVAPTAVLA